MHQPIHFNLPLQYIQAYMQLFFKKHCNSINSDKQCPQCQQCKQCIAQHYFHLWWYFPGMHGAAFYFFGAGRRTGQKENFSGEAGQGVNSLWQTTKIRAFSGRGGAGQSWKYSGPVQPFFLGLWRASLVFPFLQKLLDNRAIHFHSGVSIFF